MLSVLVHINYNKYIMLIQDIINIRKPVIYIYGYFIPVLYNYKLCTISAMAQ